MSPAARAPRPIRIPAAQAGSTAGWSARAAAREPRAWWCVALAALVLVAPDPAGAQLSIIHQGGESADIADANDRFSAALATSPRAFGI